MDKAILVKALPAEKSQSSFGGLRPNNKPVNAIEGELLIAIPGDKLVTRSDGGKPHNFQLARDMTISLRAEVDDIAPLSKREFGLLEAVKSCHTRYFLSPSKIDWGLSLRKGSEVFVVVNPEALQSAWVRSKAVVRWIGELKDQQGTFFGVEIVEETYYGQGTTDGTFQRKRYFTCQDNCGFFVALDRLSPRRDGDGLAAVPPYGTRYNGHSHDQGMQQVEVIESESESEMKRKRKEETNAQQTEQDLKSQLAKTEQDLRSQLAKSQQTEQDLRSQLAELQQTEQDLKSQLAKTEQDLRSQLAQATKSMQDLQVQSAATEQHLCRQILQSVENEQTLRTQVVQLGEDKLHLQQQLKLQSHSQASSRELEFWNVPRTDIQIVSEIGRGGWGTVLKGTFQGQSVAVKQLHPAILSKDHIQRLRREVHMMAQVRHPNLLLFIAAVFDDAVERLRSPPLIVMELLDTDLRKAYQTKLILSRDRIPIFRDVAFALNYLHNCREPIIHRDLSAPNVLLEALANSRWKAKISDFGSANLVKFAQTAAEGAIIYSAPETLPNQLRGPNPPKIPQTPKIDVYSYGVLLCEVITCKLPEEFLQLKEEVKQSWPFMHSLISSCTNYYPDDRPTIAQVLKELQKLQRE